MEIITKPASSTITLKKEDCIPLELKLNVSSKGKIWKHIGDALYDYGRGKPNATSTLCVTDDEHAFIQRLIAKPSWQLCQGM